MNSLIRKTADPKAFAITRVQFRKRCRTCLRVQRNDDVLVRTIASKPKIDERFSALQKTSLKALIRMKRSGLRLCSIALKLLEYVFRARDQKTSFSRSPLLLVYANHEHPD